MASNPEEVQPRMANGDGKGPTWKWMVGILFSVVFFGTTGWMTYMATEVNELKKDQTTDREKASAQGRSLGIIEEKTRRLEEDTKEIKQDIKEQNRKLDEILRRVK